MGGGKATNIHTFMSGCCSVQPQALAPEHKASSNLGRGKVCLAHFSYPDFPNSFLRTQTSDILDNITITVRLSVQRKFSIKGLN